MSALPKSMDAADVAREHQEHQTSSAEQYYAHRQEQLGDVPAQDGPRTPFFQLVERMRNSNRCPRCGKTRALLQLSTAAISVREERPDPRTHCACVGGPAYAGGVGSAIAPRSKFAIGTRVRAFQRIPNAWGRGVPIDWVAVGTQGTIMQLEGHIATILFDGHVQPYQHNADVLSDIVAVVDRTDGGEDFPASSGGSL